MKTKKIMFYLLLLALLWMPIKTTAKEAINLPAQGYDAVINTNPFLDPAWLSKKIILTGTAKSWELNISDLGATPLYAYHNNGMVGYQIKDSAIIRSWIQTINNELLLIPSTGTETVYNRGTSAIVPAGTGMVCQIRREFPEMLAKIIENSFTGITAPSDLNINLNDGYLVAFPAGKANIIGGSCATSLSRSSSNRIHNVALASSHLNNLTLQPGETISVSTVLTPRTVANGYKEAGVYLNGETVPGLGGGICQVSSTLYNAVMDAGLTVLTRHPHSMPVSYLRLGLDAAISAGSKDLVIRNDYDLPITLQAGVIDRTLTISVILNESLLNGTTKNLWSEIPDRNFAKTFLSTYDAAGNELNRVFVGNSRYSDPKPKEKILEIED